jgi:hypothetical protein
VSDDLTLTPLSTLGIAALEYSAERGMSVFPCVPGGKKPLTEHGYLDASTHPEQVCAWWDDNPTANIGHSPGSMGRVVIDVDAYKHPGALTWALERGLIDACGCQARTPRGGHHFTFDRPADITIANGSPWKEIGVDVRGDSGYVLLEPSIVGGRAYELIHGSYDDVTPLPDWALNEILEHQAKTAEPETTAQSDSTLSWCPPNSSFVDVVQALRRLGMADAEIDDFLDERVQSYLAATGSRGEGERNDAAYVVSQWLLTDFALEDREALAYLKEWNSRNAPPLGDRELGQVFKSAHRAGKRGAGSAHADVIDTARRWRIARQGAR